ncbi:MAG: acyl-CoA/acyl-ACP dehydrogenase [Deltaproteobacteria bacterium]|nr:MAG: acyl-CoA/acyl-ACP dehydrogenase [Deltaproteobacteria bacterium]
MDFGLSEEQALLQHTVEQFLEKECPPSRLHEIFDGDAPYDTDLWRGMTELGLAGLVVPEVHGGAGLELIDLALVAETLGRAAAPGPFLGNALATVALALGGSETQQKSWLPKLAGGEALGSVALAEPDGGWEPDAWSAAVEGGRLSATKPYVPNGASADLLVVGTAGGGLALVEGRAAGVTTKPIDAADRTRRLDELTLEAAPCEPLENGAAAAPRVRDAGLCLLAADAFGGASKCVEMSVEYAKTREQFGVTIGHFQALKHQLANMATEIEPARGLYWYAAHAFDALPEEAERAAALAKAHITDRFMQIGRDAVEAHGGIGFTWEGDVQIWFKRAMFDRAFLGTPAHLRARAAALAGW